MPNKIKTFLWKASHEAIAINHGLYKSIPSRSPYCPICQEDEESVLHHLMQCSNSKLIWDWALGHLQYPPIHFPSFKHWFVMIPRTGSPRWSSNSPWSRISNFDLTYTQAINGVSVAPTYTAQTPKSRIGYQKILVLPHLEWLYLLFLRGFYS